MRWEFAEWQPQTNLNNVLGSDIRRRRAFRYMETEVVKNTRAVGNGIEQTDMVRALKSDTQNLTEMRSGDDIYFANGEKRTVQDIRKKPSSRGGRSYAFTIIIK